MSRQAKVNSDMLNRPWSAYALDFVNRVIQRKAHRRLGNNGIEELKRHPWLKNFPWTYLSKKIMKPKYVPDRNANNFNFKNVNKPDNPIDPSLFPLLKQNNIQNLFKEYEYNREEENKRESNPIYFLTTQDSTFV
jgi:serum/glucocorticoid-regulated kinase 2/DnaJ-related protein SCJ1